MKTYAEHLHELALAAVKKYFKSESELIDILQKIDKAKSFRDFQCKSLFEYATKMLKLGENTAYNLITVARKTVEIPALKTEIAAGNLTVTKARKIAPVLTLDNQNTWIDRAKNLSQKNLEKEVARENPKLIMHEKTTYVTESRINLSICVSERLLDMLKRAQDIESVSGKSLSYEETLEQVLNVYLEKKDPLKKAERLVLRRAGVQQSEKSSSEKVSVKKNTLNDRVINIPKRESIPAFTKHQVQLRDQGQCTHRDHDGNRCASTRWLQMHHLVEVESGGKNTLENLTTLCQAHHVLLHAVSA